MTVIRALAFGAIVCLASWAGLALAAGQVGLSHSVTRDPVFFATTYPLAIALSLTAAFAAAFIFARIQRTPRAFAATGAATVLLGDALASFVVAPVLVGELEIQHGFIVLLAVSLYGSQIIAAWLGVMSGAEKTAEEPLRP